MGFGNDGLIAPIVIGGKYRAGAVRPYVPPRRAFGSGYVLQKKNEDGFDPLFAFTLDECSSEDFLMSNHFTATFPGSFF